MLRPILISALLAATALAQVPAPPPAVPPPAPGTAPKTITNPTPPPADGTAAPAQAAPPPPAVPAPAVPAVPTPAAPPAPVATPPTVQPVPAPAPGPRPASAAVPLNNQPRNPAAGEPIYFPNTSVTEVLEQYADRTKKKLIYSTQVVGNVYIHVKGVTSDEEWIKIVELSLAMNGFVIVPTDDPNIMRVTGVGQSPKSVGIPFVDREELLPIDEQVVMYLFKLKWADPTELANTLAQGVLTQGQNNPYSSIIPLPKANALLVSENTFLIRKLISIVRAIDVEPVAVESKFFTLEHAQAEDVVTSLEKLFEKTQTTQTAGVPGQPPRPQRAATDGAGNPLPTTGGGAASPGPSVSVEGETTGTGPTEDSIIVGKVKMTADKRTNRIHIVTRPVNWKLIDLLIEKYDEDVKLPEPLVRALRFRKVEEIVESIVSAIQDPGEKSGAGGTTGAGGALGQQRPGQTQNQNQFNQNTGQNRFGATGFDGGVGGSSAGALGESLSTQERDTRPVATQIGKSTIIADTQNNAIIVVGTADVKQKVGALIDELDVRQKQVLIEVVIGELRLTNNESFGIEYLLKNGGALTGTNNGPGTGTGATGNSLLGFTGTGGGLNVNNLLNQQNITRALQLSGSGFNGYLAAGNAFNAIVNILESDGKFRVITKPRVFTTNGKRAIITSGEEVPVPTSILSSFNQGTGGQPTSQSSIQFKPIELRLEVLPLINSDKEVSLEIVQNISERAGTTLIDNNPIVNVSRRALKTNITVPNNGTIILGGLIKESNDLSKAGLPGLSKIPLIGPLFGSRTKDKIRSELIVLMRPVVTTSPAEDMALREKTFEAFNIPADVAHALDPVGVREKITRPKVIKMGSLPTPRMAAPPLRDDGKAAGRRR